MIINCKASGSTHLFFIFWKPNPKMSFVYGKPYVLLASVSVNLRGGLWEITLLLNITYKMLSVSVKLVFSVNCCPSVWIAYTGDHCSRWRTPKYFTLTNYSHVDGRLNTSHWPTIPTLAVHFQHWPLYTLTFNFALTGITLSYAGRWWYIFTLIDYDYNMHYIRWRTFDLDAHRYAAGAGYAGDKCSHWRKHHKAFSF